MCTSKLVAAMYLFTYHWVYESLSPQNLPSLDPTPIIRNIRGRQTNPLTLAASIFFHSNIYRAYYRYHLSLLSRNTLPTDRGHSLTGGPVITPDPKLHLRRRNRTTKLTDARLPKYNRLILPHQSEPCVIHIIPSVPLYTTHLSGSLDASSPAQFDSRLDEIALLPRSTNPIADSTYDIWV